MANKEKIAWGGGEKEGKERKNENRMDSFEGTTEFEKQKALWQTNSL